MVSTVLDEQALKEKQEILRQTRMEKYACQSVAKRALPNERVSNCLRGIVGDSVEIWKHMKTDKTFFGGLMVCGSVWICPVCAAKISERRKNELKCALETHKKLKGNVALLTLTFSHKRSDSLTTLLEAFGKAVTRFMSGKRFNAIRVKMGIIGRVKVTEVTYGANGFHPHAHIALFYTNDEVDLNEWERNMYELWEKACVKEGLETKRKYGLHLQGAEEVAAYLNKHGNWSLEQEMTKSHIKKGKMESMTPFDFLRNFLETNDEKQLKLFREYAAAFKGKRQVHWSRGLKDRFGIMDKADEEIAKEKVEVADLLGILSPEEWRHILHNDKRAQLLNNIEVYGFNAGVVLTLQS